MPFSLFPLSKSALEWLADSRVPDEFRSRAEPGSLPPAFVAARSLRLETQRAPDAGSTAFLIVRNEDARFVGACGFKTAAIAGRLEVGYGVAPASRGLGAATTALRLLSQLAFDAGATELLAEILPDNAASIRVVQKAGFARVGSRIDEENDYVDQWLLRRTI